MQGGSAAWGWPGHQPCSSLLSYCKAEGFSSKGWTQASAWLDALSLHCQKLPAVLVWLLLRLIFCLGGLCIAEYISSELKGCVAAQACEALPGGGRSHSEMLLVGRGLMRDFERYGVHLSAAQQQQLAEATQTAHTTGMQIGNRI